MSKQVPEITAELAEWMAQQRVFFVASAPLAASGHVNCSPKGGEAFRVLDPRAVAYLDYTGSGAETAAHLRENGRLVIMFCAFEGSPRILRLHGHGEVLETNHPEFAELSALFRPNPGTRAIVRVNVTRVSTSCGYSVPLYEHRGQRAVLDKWATTKGADGLRDYRRQKNQRSIDGLPALTDVD
ncbi:MAG: pyridoxamine 5'-phosphate oxidase family protein [Verrucomicrobia bacterium]|nr:pyridoxamine 5'-phosphate oxidase family protein [Verrucomicrobiota bacterium]